MSNNSPSEEDLRIFRSELLREREEYTSYSITISCALALLDEIERLRQRSVSCCFCNEQFSSLNELKQHSAICEAHPLAVEVANLRHIEAKLWQIMENCYVLPAENEAEYAEFLKQLAFIKENHS